jgi:nitrite reductase/ring-hydroxylating ferredoxin subunit
MAEERIKTGRSGRGNVERRSFLGKTSSLAMSAGLAAGYGLFALIAGRFLYPARRRPRQWMFVIEAERLRQGQTVLYRGPAGETINITRQERRGDAGDFIALSSTCPHLGCQVHWEAHNDRFFCPCHNGEFDASGVGVAGPPGDAGLKLPRYALKIEEGLLYIEVPVDTLSATNAGGEVIERVEGIHGPGHDPCLAASPGRRDTVA